MSYEFADEFSTIVKHNFKQYVLLTSRNIHWREEYILETIYGLNGYVCHKTVKYENNSSHIHVKFEEEYMAKEAVDFLINLNSDLTAVLVDDMLRDWYNFEKSCGFPRKFSITAVDIVGNPPFGVNFLTDAILNSIFRDFCCPYVLPYTAALNEPHAQVIFGSMTEALAACITFGEWWVKGRKMDSFSFRVRINPSEKEASLITYSGGTPSEAFKLDYFVNPRNESVLAINEQYANQNISYDYLQSKGSRKFQKPKFATVNIGLHRNELHAPVANGSSIICVPVIAPFNTYAQSLMASSGQMEVNANNVQNFQRTQNIRSTAAETDCWTLTQSENVVDFQSSVQRVNTEVLNQSGISSEVICSDSNLGSAEDFQGKPDLIPPFSTMKQRRNGKKGHLRFHGRKY